MTAPITDRQRQADIVFDFATSHRRSDTNGSLWETLMSDVLAAGDAAVTVQAGRAGIRLRTFDGQTTTGWRPLLDEQARTWQEVAAAKCGGACNTSTDIEDYQT